MSNSRISLAVVTGAVTRRAGGLFTSVRRSSQALAERSIEVSVYGLRDDHDEIDLPAWAPLAPRLFDCIGPSALGIAAAMPRALICGGHSVLHQHGLWQYPSIATLRWRRHTGRPTVISPRGMLDPWALQNSQLKKRVAARLFERANLNSASCLHALNRSEAEAMRAFGLRNPIAVIPNAIDLPLTHMVSGVTPPEWAKGGRAPLLFLGRIHPKKGLDESLEAWAKLKIEAPEISSAWRLVLAGWDDGGHLPTLIRKAQDLGLTNEEVVFPGPLFGPDKVAALAHAKAFLLASLSEGLPMSVLEAWAFSLPVFMSEACNLPIGFDWGAAILAPTEPSALAATLKAHLGRSDLPALGARGRALVEQRFTWDQVAHDFDVLYRWLMTGSLADAPTFVELPDDALCRGSSDTRKMVVMQARPR